MKVFQTKMFNEKRQRIERLDKRCHFSTEIYTVSNAIGIHYAQLNALALLEEGK